MMDEAVTLHHGDCLDILPTLEAGSVDAVVCDPPYALEFMGRAWDGWDSPSAFQAWCEKWARECLRVLKPGGFMLAFGGTRTSHRLTCGIEDAGFQVRDAITWHHGQGFPKSLAVGNGLGTALKPASEPIVVARKPLAGTVAQNVQAFGTGALNIDGCRVAAQGRPLREVAPLREDVSYAGTSLAGRVDGTLQTSRAIGTTDTGRWPANVILSHCQAPDGGDGCEAGCAPGCPVAELDAQSGVSSSPPVGSVARTRGGQTIGTFAHAGRPPSPNGHGDSGGASRFFPTFRYQAKAPSRERPKVDGIAHPTCKPLELMRWLVRLVTPPGGTVCDPFAGSGTTAEACQLEGFRCIAIEREADYLPLVRARLDRNLQPTLL